MTEESQIEDNYDDALFSNEQVYPRDIPTIATIEFSKLQPSYRNVSIIATLIFFGIATAVLIFLWSMDIEFVVNYITYLGLAIAVLCSFILIIVILEFERKSYALREKDIMYNEGIVWHTSTVIPFNRVQHCEISQGPIERMFGLSELKVFTAGGASSDMSIPGLEPETAERLKEYIVLKTGLDEEE